MPAPRSGLDAAGPHGTELHSTGLPGTGLNGFGLAGTGLTGTGLTGTGLATTRADDAETTPLPVLTGALPLGFESEISRLASLAPINNGKPHDDAADGGLADNGVADIRPPSHSRRRIPRAASAAASRPPGVARGLLMTPWFAAASGFVIAASLWIHSSHPQLAFPIVTGSAPPCIPDGCSPHSDQQGAGSLIINSGQPKPPQHKPATAAKKATRDQTPTAASGLTFGYVERPAADGNFWLTVTVTGKRSIKDWHLAFVLAGDQIQYVFGADWKGQGTDRVAASPLTGDTGQQGGGRWHAGDGPSDQGAGQGGYGHGGAPDKPVAFFTVIASGKPAAPTQCSFNGTSCTFHELPGASQGGR
ncbi:MAG TPA: hypothetical protein VGH53_29875 [Streptosporangiaceae bacterium]